MRFSLGTHGPAYVASWVLLQNDPDGEIVQIAEGAALAALARATLTAV